MPQVPTQDTFGVMQSSMPNARVTTPDYQDFSSDQMMRTGRAMGDVGGVAARVALDAQNELNKLRVNAAMNEAVAERMRLTYDPQEGFLGVKGERAINWSKDKSLDQDYSERFQTSIEKIASTLGNDEQRKMFLAAAGAEYNRFVGTAKHHMVGELEAYEKAERAKTIDLAQNRAAAAGLERPDEIAVSRKAIVNAVNSDGKLSPVQKEAELVAQLSPMHTAVIASALEKDRTEAAKAYFTEIRAELTPEARMRIEKALEVSGDKVFAQNYVKEAVAAGKTREQMLAEAQEKFEGDRLEKVEARINNFFQSKNAAEAQSMKDLGKSAWSQVMSNGDITATTEADLKQKNPEELRQIRDWQRAMRNNREHEDTPEKFDKFYKLYRMAMDDPGKFVDLDLRQSLPYVTKGQMGTLVSLQGSINKQDAKASDEVRMTKFALDTIKTEAQALGIDFTPKEGTAAARQTNAFMGALTQALVEARQQKGSPLTRDEAKAVGMDMLREGIEQGSGIFGLFPNRKRGYEIATDPNIKPGTNFVAARYGDIPEQWRMALTAEVRDKYGLGTRPLNEQQRMEVERMYTRAVRAGRKINQE